MIPITDVMIAIQHKQTHNLKFVPVTDWVDAKKYTQKYWRVLDIEDVVMVYNGKRFLYYQERVLAINIINNNPLSYNFKELNYLNRLRLSNNRFVRYTKNQTTKPIIAPFIPSWAYLSSLSLIVIGAWLTIDNHLHNIIEWIKSFFK